MFFGSWISCRRFASFSSSSIFVLRFFSVVVSRDVKERERESTRARFSLLFFKLSLSLFNTAQCNKVSLSFSSAAFPLKKKTASLGVAAVLVFRVSNIFFFRGERFFWVRFCFSFLSGAKILVFFITLERSARLLFFFFFQRIIVTQRKLSFCGERSSFFVAFLFIEQKTRFRFLEQTT